MNVLIACERSGIVREQFKRMGHNAWSCDLEPTRLPGNHLQCDVFEAINLIRWDLMIAHPPCTFLTVTRNKWFKPQFDLRFPTQHQDRIQAKAFFMRLAKANVKRIAIENPIGIMSTSWRKPDQIIQPWQFGDPERKATCLWLKNLPKLIWEKETNLFAKKTTVTPNIIQLKNGGTMSAIHFNSVTLSKDERTEIRSNTFEGIAKAMAEQWGAL